MFNQDESFDTQARSDISTEQLRIAQDIANLGFWEIDIQTRRVTLSNQLYALLGVQSPQRFSLGKLLSYIHPDDKDDVVTTHTLAVREKRQDVQCQFRAQHYDGQICWMNGRARITYDADGAVISLAGTCQDITNEKATEAALRQYEQAIESSGDLIVAVDRNYRYLMANQTYLTYYQKRRDEIIGQPVWQVVGKNAFQQIKPKLDHCFAGGRLHFQMTRVFSGIGERELSIIHAPLLDDNVNTIGAVANIRDVTDEHALKTALQSSQYRFEEMFDKAPIGIFRTSSLGYVLDLNQEMARIVGCTTPQEAIDHFSLLQKKLYKDPERRNELLDQLKTKGAVRGFEYEAFQKDGTPIRLAMDARISTFVSDDEFLIEGFAWDVTEETFALLALRHSEARYRALVEDMPHMICRFTADCKLTFVNQAYARYFGMTVDDLIGVCFLNFLPEADQSDILEMLDLLTPYEPIKVIEHQIIRDGQSRWMRWTNRLLGYEDGKAVEYQSLGEDITDRKVAEERLKLLSQAVDQAADAVIITDANGVIEYVNPAFEQFTGYSVDETIAQTPAILRSNQHPDTFYKAMWDTILRKEIFRGQVINRKKTGEIYYEQKTISPILDENGDIQKFVSTAKDITKQKAAEAALRASEERFRLLIDHAAEAIFVHDLEGRLMIVNQAACRGLGYSAEEMVQLKISDVDYQVDMEQFKVEWQSLKRSDSITLESTHQAKNGRTFPVEVRMSKMIIDEEEVILALTRDISDRKTFETALKRARWRAEKANQAKSDYLGSISHELRTPLNGIIGYAQILSQDTTLSAEQREKATVIQNSANYLLNLVNDIADLSKIEARQMKLVMNPVSLSNLLNDVCDMVRHRIESKNLQFVTRIETDLPRVIEVDETRLCQVLLNLLSNATKFTQQGQVVFSVFRTGGSTRFQVEDTGVGMADDQIQDIFSPFTRLKTPRRYEGTGLGLAISQNLVRLMGSQVHVESTPQQGSRFWFDLPLREIDSGLENPTRVDDRIIGYKGEAIQVLIVDDRWENRLIFNNMLGPLGFNILEAETGEQALEFVAGERPDIVFLDLVMPDIDSFDLHEAMKIMSDDGSFVCIGTSASITGDLTSICLDNGLQGFLAKPFEKQELITILEQNLPIEWRYHSTVDAQIPVEDPIVFPPSETLKQLLDVTKTGNIRRIRELLEQVESEEFDLEPFVKKAADLLSGFQLMELETILTQALEGK